MAHFVLEYSTNIPADLLDLQELFSKLHGAAEATGIFPYKGIRSRAHPVDHFRVADGNPEHAFVHLSVLIGAGRSDDEKQTASESFFAVYSSHFDALFAERGVALSFEMKELEPVYKYNRNNIQDYL